MTNYDFRVLNDKDFESLVCDLLSMEFAGRVERFKAGKDAGVDLRWFNPAGSETIIQCKHWPRSSVATIIRHINKSEREKVDRLAPTRYIFACSLELSRANKKAIHDAFSPHVRSEADILGAEDLQDLLSKHSDVERKHYKLWLSSSAVLAALLNNAVFGRSEDALHAIKEDLSRYVETSEAVRARERLDQVRVLIIKGEPGVGKTTLAKQLIAESMADEFKLVVIESDISEAEDVFDPGAKQIFYFDDFLGRNFLEAINDNKDSHVVNFIKRVVRDRNKRFVLTTRTHILDRGKQLSEIFRIEKVGKNEFELTVGALSRLEKGKILYSHIWNSGLPAWAIEELYRDKRYLQIIDHTNFNPRIISFITDVERLTDVPSENYWDYINATLDNPEAIWGHVFENQLARDTRDLAVLVAFNGKPIVQEALEAAFVRLNQQSNDNSIQIRQRFSIGLKLAVGSVLNRVIDGSGSAKCSLFNPSISDYLLKDGVILQSASTSVRSLRTIDSVSYLESLLKAGLVGREIFLDCVESLCRDMSSEQCFIDDLAVYLAAIVVNYDLTGHAAEFSVAVANRLVPEDIGYGSRNELRIFSFALCGDRLDDSVSKYLRVFERLDAMAIDGDHIAPIRDCAAHLDKYDGGSRVASLRLRVVDLVIESVQDIVTEANLLDDLYYSSDWPAARTTLKDYFADLFDEMGLDVDSGELDDFIDYVDYEEIINDNISSAGDDYHEESRGGPVDVSSAEIVDYFDRADVEPS